MAKTNKLPIYDIYLASYLSLKGISPELVKHGTRIVFEFPPTDEVYRLTREYNDNPQIDLLNFVTAIRKLKAQMFSVSGVER